MQKETWDTLKYHGKKSWMTTFIAKLSSSENYYFIPHVLQMSVIVQSI